MLSKNEIYFAFDRLLCRDFDFLENYFLQSFEILFNIFLAEII